MGSNAKKTIISLDKFFLTFAKRLRGIKYGREQINVNVVEKITMKTEAAKNNKRKKYQILFTARKNNIYRHEAVSTLFSYVYHYSSCLTVKSMIFIQYYDA